MYFFTLSYNQGTIIRYIEDELIQILSPNSTVISKLKNKSWVAIGPDGSKTTIDAQQNATNEKQKVLFEYHTDSKKRVFERDDLTCVTIEDSGSLVIDHADGSKVFVTAKTKSQSPKTKGADEETIVLPSSYSSRVEKPGYATVINGQEKDSSKIILPNGTTVIRGTRQNGKSQDSFTFIQSVF
jgi:hypothetical protein